MQNTTSQKPGQWTLAGWCLLAGCTSLIILWALVSVDAFQPILLAPLGVIHKLSWALFGSKVIPDGGGSTLYVSAYFFAVGPLIVALFQRLRRTRSSPNARGRKFGLAEVK